jgi:hypothetical protein
MHDKSREVENDRPEHRIEGRPMGAPGLQGRTHEPLVNRPSSCLFPAGEGMVSAHFVNGVIVIEITAF